MAPNQNKDTTASKKRKLPVSEREATVNDPPCSACFKAKRPCLKVEGPHKCAHCNKNRGNCSLYNPAGDERKQLLGELEELHKDHFQLLQLIQVDDKDAIKKSKKLLEDKVKQLYEAAE